jgi:purine catabolism regulator
LHNELMLTVHDALERPLFRRARVIAGKNGLHRRIRWVHILEITNFDTLIHGEEMILSTGIGFKSGKENFTTYLQKLIDLHVSCLCLEIGNYVESIPEDAIRLANEHNFPLIIFPETVLFVDITQDLHPLIINRHYKMMQKLESVSREFHRSTLTSQGTLNVLKLLHTSTRAQIVYLPLEGKPYFVPNSDITIQKDLLDSLYKRIQERSHRTSDFSPLHWREQNKNILVHPVGAMGQTWAFITLIRHQEPTEYDYLVLDSAALSIAQDLLRKRYMEERKLHAENLWVNDLVHNRIEDEEQIKALIGSEYKKLNSLHYRVCVIQIENIPDSEGTDSAASIESIGFHLSLLLRSIFEQHAFRPFITLKNNHLVVVALDVTSLKQSKEKDEMKERLQYALNYIKEINNDKKVGHFELRIGIGKAYTGLKNAYLSYQEAANSLSLYTYYKRSPIFYDELGVFQLFMNLQKGNILESFIHDYLGPLLEEDKRKGSDLLRTLKVYLDNNGSKKLTAEHLYIVRQSLYYRIEKIKELLGEDFMSPDNQLALQLALRAYQFLYPDKLDST